MADASAGVYAFSVMQIIILSSGKNYVFQMAAITWDGRLIDLQWTKTPLRLGMNFGGISVPLLVPLCTVILCVFVPRCANVEMQCKQLKVLWLFGVVRLCATMFFGV